MRTTSQTPSRRVSRWRTGRPRSLGRAPAVVSMLVLGALVAVLGAVAPASAASPAGQSLAATAEVASGRALVWDPATERAAMATPAEAERIVQDYWTTERLEQARPVPSTADYAAAGSAFAESRQGTERTVVEPALPTEAAPASAAHFSYANGKAFFRNPVNGLNYSCSGGAVSSGSQRLVVTAGHCVHPGNGGTNWMQNWIFIPGYTQGSEPRGRFAAYWFSSSTGWTQNANHQRDFAFVTTHNNASGQRLVNAVGGHGLTINPGRPYVHIAGYPSNFGGGEAQWNCWGTTTRWSTQDPGQKLACGWGPGGSGGPWLRDFGSSGLGYVISNMQGVSGQNNYGPYYDNHVGDVFAGASNIAP